MIDLVLIALGGGIGAGLRFAARDLILPSHRFPIGITVVNVAGSFVLGIVVGADPAAIGAFDVELVTLGLLGGFTTFSTWMVDIDTAETTPWKGAVLVVPLVLGLAAAWLGVVLGVGLG